MRESSRSMCFVIGGLVVAALVSGSGPAVSDDRNCDEVLQSLLSNRPLAAGASLEALPPLIDNLNCALAQAAAHPGAWHPGNVALGAPELEYRPSPAELDAMEIGERIRVLVSGESPATVAAVLDDAGVVEQAVEYPVYETYQVKVMGTGLFTYFDRPKRRRVVLRPSAGDREPVR